MSNFTCSGGGAKQIVLITDKAGLYIALATAYVFTLHALVECFIGS